MTSNVGSEYIRQLEKIGFAVSASDETRQKETGEEMKTRLKPLWKTGSGRNFSIA